MNRTRRQTRRYGCRAWLAPLVFALMARPAAASTAGPSTFDTTVGAALLCVDTLGPEYFISYLTRFFGAPYKREGGAYWFKVNDTLWGINLVDVFVSDDAGNLDFIGAVVQASPQRLSQAILDGFGMEYQNVYQSRYSPLISSSGSMIVYLGDKAKIYCAKERVNLRIPLR